MESMPTFDNYSGKNTIEDVEISEALALKRLENLEVNKSLVPNGLHPRLFKELSNGLN